jgi:maltose alpha-D-glucosyltransferase/alpha-amylase
MKKLASATDPFWSGWLAGHGLAVLEAALPEWLPRQRWFGAKSREIKAVRLLDWVEMPAVAANTTTFPAVDLPVASIIPSALFFVQIEYADGPRDVYQIPLAVSTGADANDVIESQSQGILATLASPTGPAVVHDACFREDMRQGLLALIERSATLALSTTRTTALEVAASQVAATTGHAAKESVISGESADLPVHPERATHAQTTRGAVHLRPREAPTAGNPDPIDGRLDARASAAFSGVYDQHLSSRIGSAEQSNTSIIYGQKLILKLFRRLQPGENPDVEIGRFLTEIARFPRIPPFLGEITVTPAQGGKTTTAMLQGLVENQGDGWRWFLDHLQGFFAAAAALPPPPESAGPSFLSEREPSPEARKYAGTAIAAAALLGRRTAEMHLALSTPTNDPAFAAEPFTLEDLDRDARNIETQVTSVLDVLKSKFSTFDDVTSDAAVLLLSRGRGLIARARAVTGLAAAGLRIRIHGDYHLGQTLRTEAVSTEKAAGASTDTGDFVLLDFEGEPARSLVERRRKQSPLKDVAGMIRSFSYAAHSGLDQYLTANPEIGRGAGPDQLVASTLFWQNSISAEFLRAYRETVASNTELLPSAQQSQSLLSVYILEKAMYELLYELNNRPAWIHIPIAGILALDTVPGAATSIG